MSTKSSQRVPTLVKRYTSELDFLSDHLANERLGGLGLNAPAEQVANMKPGQRCRLELWLPDERCLRAIGQLKWCSEEGSIRAVILSYGHLSETDRAIVQALQWKHREAYGS